MNKRGNLDSVKSKKSDLLIANNESLNPIEIKFLERDKMILKRIKSNPELFKEGFLKLKASTKEENRLMIDISNYQEVVDNFNKAIPDTYLHVPRRRVSSSLNYPVSSQRSDKMGNFHLGVGVGTYVDDQGSGPDFRNGAPEDASRNVASATICHSFPINSFMRERNYTIKSHVTVPLGGVQFRIHDPRIPNGSTYSGTYFSGYLIGNLRMKLFVNNQYKKTVKKMFLRCYKNLAEDFINEVSYNNEMETDIDIVNGSTLRVEIEVEIIASNTSHVPNGNLTDFPAVFIGAQYFNPEFISNEDYNHVRYQFINSSETSDFAAPIKLDYIKVSDTELKGMVNPPLVDEDMQFS